MTAEESHPVPRKLWEHPDPSSTSMYKFMVGLNEKYGLNLKTFQDLHQFSLSNRSAFWSSVLSSANYISSGSYTRPVDESIPIDSVPKWFDGLSLNFAENMLYGNGKEDDKIAIVEVREGGKEKEREVTYGELRERAGKLAKAMKKRGLKRGDRVVVVAANSVETLVVLLGVSWLGGVFSSSSTDMGVEGVLGRARLVDPKWLFMDDAAVYNGKTVDLRAKMTEIVQGLSGCRQFEGVISIPRFEGNAKDVSGVPKAETWNNFLSAAAAGSGPVPEFVRIPFHEPLLICYSSGTTGTPKAIVHSVGGIMINYFKEGVLHEGLDSESVTLQYTTTGWIMYLANVGTLLFGGRSILYDGSPFIPDATILVKVAEKYKATKLGISPRWMFELSKAGISPREIADLSKLKVVTSTGMVLSEQLFEWFYEKGFPSSVQLGNISGGTDIAGCFGLLNPLTPVYVGGTQGPSLGIKVVVYDSTVDRDGTKGQEVEHGVPGELVAACSFPNVPCYFWGDSHVKSADGKEVVVAAPPGSKYHSAYFARFQNVWAHGDFCIVHPVTGQIFFLGRADGVLNPSGVRFGSAEIYGVLERWFSDRIQDSLCVGQRRPQDTDESVMLFLLMKPGHKFDRGLVNEVKEAIRRDLSKRHVPKWIFETPEIPTTINLKKVELPVKQIVSGQKIKASGTLANPQSLEYYYQFAKVEELVGPKEKL
ncbi:acetoacetyl-CoA synthetase [Podospora fimiseda]|uniref:Acetoacetyl-CoA synthetase n=1 Tax=Podospora fimiseda TaxID=252190 RepID=A0AAN7GVR7_9PEZI|nr:acetoacetyl-CoA synthetase [Podospora fimiseda]